MISTLKKPANSQNFVMGNDETELELSVESRSFVNQVNDQVRKRQKNFKRCRRRRRTFYYLVNVYGCNDEFSHIHGEEFPRQSEFVKRVMTNDPFFLSQNFAHIPTSSGVLMITEQVRRVQNLVSGSSCGTAEMKSLYNVQWILSFV